MTRFIYALTFKNGPEFNLYEIRGATCVELNGDTGFLQYTIDNEPNQ